MEWYGGGWPADLEPRSRPRPAGQRREGTRAVALVCERDGDLRWARARERGGSFAVAAYL